MPKKLRQFFAKLTHRHEEEDKSSVSAPRGENLAESRMRSEARPKRVESDIPLDGLGNTYTPTQTSLKSSFRTDGRDRQRDQDNVADNRWNDEDRFTNKSGDPRIGTHGRTYEPGERRGRK